MWAVRRLSVHIVRQLEGEAVPPGRILQDIRKVLAVLAESDLEGI
jgi:hypothetical protein